MIDPLRALLALLAAAVCCPATFADEPVSFARDIRPQLAAKCFGCHQGARADGDYIMTRFDRMLAGGESGDPVIVRGEPDESYLVELITSHDGQAEMPPTGDPLDAATVDLIRNWIADGAPNDYTKSSYVFDQDHVPVYSTQPNVTSLDYSPDGKLIAVTGFHEVLLIDAESPADSDPSQAARIVKRLIGMIARVESVRFSPDGSRLAVSGGNPGELGEVQIWDVASGKLKLSHPVSFDTVFGVNWSPDGKLVSFGCTDTTIRAINAETGDQVLFQGAHEDWVRDTVFSPDGKQLVSVGRDMTCKLTEVETQRFIDNITSITPGVLKGGIASVASHPTRAEVVIGGSDGVPKVYRMNRITKRVIGDDANLVRLLPEMPGRIQSVAVSRDGKRIAAGSSLDGRGAVQIYSYEFDPQVSDPLKKILQKQPSQWSQQEREQVDAYNRAGVEVIASAEIESSGVYTVAFSPDGKHLAAAGADGLVRIYETESGSPVRTIEPVVMAEQVASPADHHNWQFAPQDLPVAQPVQVNAAVTAIRVSPENLSFTRPTDYAQLVVMAVLADGSTIDITHQAKYKFDEQIISLNNGLVQAVQTGETFLAIEHLNSKYQIPVSVDLPVEPIRPNFIRDVNPVLTKLGCNAGTCHGSADGKMGFKLSLRGYDPIFDTRSLTDDLGSRRINVASAHDSLMLMKPTTEVAHQGGHLIKKDSRYYRLIHDWIRDGAPLDLETPKVAKLDVFPANPVLLDADWNQQMRVVATYTDGIQRDVTREAFLEVGQIEIAKMDGSVVTALRRGETPILARYEGAYTATTLTVMGDRNGFAWQPPETWGKIDELVADKWQRLKILPSNLCTDAEFIRRVYLDLTGLPPTAEQVDQFLADSRPTRDKRNALIDTLIGNDDYVEHWANKWADLMQVNRKYLGADGARALRDWIREQVKSNRPYDEFAREILTASGSNKENPAASYFKIHRTPDATMENTTHLFLATRFNCNKCHDHPFERWTQDQYYETAAYFAQVSLQKDPASGDQRIGGSAVEGAKPLYEVVTDSDSGEVKHDRTGKVTSPQFPFDCEHEVPADATRRQQLAAWITAPTNPYFAKSYVNRLWGYLLGVGLIEPLDDIRASNPPTNPQLLEYLTDEFIQHDFDTRHVIRLICQSRTYQLSIEANEFNADDALNYSHARARRLPAEVLFDTIHFVTGSELNIPGVAAGTRASALPDAGVKLPSGFLTTLGRPARESACECERSGDLQLGSVLALVSGPDVSRAIGNSGNQLAKLVEQEQDDRKVIDQIYLRVLNRHATDEEISLALETFAEIDDDHTALVSQRDQRQREVDARLPELEKQRLAAIEQTTNELDQAIQKIDAKLLEKEAQRKAAIESAEAELKTYRQASGGFDAWLARETTQVQWHPLLPTRLESKNGRPMETRADRSVLVQNKAGKDLYTVVTQTDLSGISAVRLELLADTNLPSGGPGLAENGNLVLTEFEIEAAHPDRPNQWARVEIESAKANFEQNGFSINNTFNGKTNDRGGWALAGANGKTSWASFQLKLPIGFSGGTRLRFKLHQRFDDQHQIGCFRISVSRFHRPVGLSLSENLLAELSKPEQEWQSATKPALTASFEKSDPKLAQFKSALADASQPLKIDPEIVRLREKLDRVSKPVPPDSTLEQLTWDVVASQAQLDNLRLTAAQDLTWALINSPSFLFNH